MFLAGIPASNRISKRYASFKQVTDFSSGIFPLLPDNTSQAPDDPAVQGLEYVPCFSQAVIVPPSSEVHIQLFNDLGEAEPAVPVCKFPNPFFKALDCFPVYANFGLATHTDLTVCVHPESKWALHWSMASRWELLGLNPWLEPEN